MLFVFVFHILYLSQVFMNEYNFRYISTLQINKMTKESEMERKLDIEGELHYYMSHSITSLEQKYILSY